MLNQLILYFKATRPQFLSITLLAFLIGYRTPTSEPIQIGYASFALLLALLAHSAANIINDYYDDMNGSDRTNTTRISPFTGGSRFIQDNLLTPHEAKIIGITLFILVIIGGLILSYLSTFKLIGVGIVGIILGWSYSANPIKLMSRGIWGELAITSCWALIVVGSSLIRHETLSVNAVLLGLSYGLIISNILLVNQLPDVPADTLASKKTLAVEVGANHVWKWFLTFLMSAYAILIGGFLLGIFEKSILISVLALPIAIKTAAHLRKNYADRNTLTTCIKETILFSHLFGCLLLISL